MRCWASKNKIDCLLVYCILVHLHLHQLISKWFSIEYYLSTFQLVSKTALHQKIYFTIKITILLQLGYVFLSIRRLINPTKCLTIASLVKDKKIILFTKYIFLYPFPQFLILTHTYIHIGPYTHPNTQLLVAIFCQKNLLTN